MALNIKDRETEEAMRMATAYALAKSRGWPLLYKGEDFALTDIERA